MKASISARCRYRFDNYMSKGIGSMLTGLIVVFLASLGLVVALRFAFFSMGWRGQYMNDSSGAVHLKEGEVMDQNFFHHIYLTFLQMTDPGNMAQDILAHPGYKIATIIAGIVGLILVSALVGMITTWLMERMAELRKGHSQVIERGHTVILGWEPQRVIEILRELIEANESERHPCVCILAEDDKEEMDDWLALNLPEKERSNTRVVTRSGLISSTANLKIATVGSCKSVIVLATCNQSAPEGERQESDARVVKAILAVSGCERESGDELNIVAEIFDKAHRSIIIDICPHRVTVVDAWDILAKIIVQTSRSVGLSVAYSELLSFQGCEMYFHQAKWGGIPFGQLQFHFADGVPLGVRSGGAIQINPPVDRPVQDGEDILIVADDDSTIKFRRKPVAQPDPQIRLVESRRSQQIERELLIGWNHMAPIIVEQYADYVLEGSEVTVLVDGPTDAMKRELARLGAQFPNLNIVLVNGDPFIYDILRSVNPEEKDNILILNKSGDSSDAEKADSETILILLMLRTIFQDSKLQQPPKLIAEVADSSNQSLVSSSGVRDFIISNRVVSMLLAQISEEPDVKKVYDDLFEGDGSEIYLKPMRFYQAESQFPVHLTFADCMSLAQQRKEVCIGIKITAHEENEDKNFGVELIPDKKEKFVFGPNDCLVVVAEDET